MNLVTLPATRDVLTLLNLKPAAIITTVGRDGSVNAAPFSQFSIVDYDPPRLIFSTHMERDTYRNVLETGEFVVNYPSIELLDRIWVTSKHFPYGVSELDQAHLRGVPAATVTPPRIADCGVHVECRVLWTKPIGSSCLVLGDIVALSADRDLEQLEVQHQVRHLNPPLYVAFRTVDQTRTWMFAEIGKIYTIRETDGKIQVTSDTCGPT